MAFEAGQLEVEERSLKQIKMDNAVPTETGSPYPSFWSTSNPEAPSASYRRHSSDGVVDFCAIHGYGCMLNITVNMYSDNIPK